MIEELKKITKELKPQMIDFCRSLIKMPSLSGKERGVADLYLAEMKKLGYDEVFRDAWGNVIGVINGTESGPSILFNGHLDHVDTGDYSEWGGYDPYGAVIDRDEMYNQDMNGYEETEVIHGRAAADVKGGGATMVYAGAALVALRRAGFPVKGRLIFTMTVLEEPAEMLGMIKLMDETFPNHGLSADVCISCEATSLKLYLGHRGRVEMQVTISGVTSHASAPWLGVNAVNKATKFIDRVERVVDAEKHIDPDLGASSIALTIIDCTPGSMCIVPDRCTITYDRRLTPEESAEDCLAQIRRIIDDIASEDETFRAEVKIAAVKRTSYTGMSEVIQNKKEGWKLDREHPVAQACADALQSVGQEPKFGYWDFGTDLPVTAVRHGIPSIGYSPMQEYYCHRPVDKVRIDYMEKALLGYVAIFNRLGHLNKKDFAL